MNNFAAEVLTVKYDKDDTKSVKLEDVEWDGLDQE